MTAIRLALSPSPTTKPHGDLPNRRNGYIGSYLAAGLLEGHDEPLNLLVRAKDHREAEQRLWHRVAIALRFSGVSAHLDARIRIFRGDLTEAHFGLTATNTAPWWHSTDSVLHCAASLNRKSEKSCLNVNLRGTLEVTQLARRAQRCSRACGASAQVSTVAVAGHRSNEVVSEDRAIDWERSDYDPYARTKKFCEHMVRELLARRAAYRLSPEHRAGRQPPPGNHAVRHGARVRFPGGSARAAVSPETASTSCRWIMWPTRW